MKKFILDDKNYDNVRLDRWLKNNFSSLNQGFIEKNLRKGNIKINKKKISSGYKLKLNDEIQIYNFSVDVYANIKTDLFKKIIPEKYLKLFNSSIMYENKDFIILDKWSGIATQGGSKINISIDHIIKSISNDFNLVHRLDRETSGLLIIAKNLQATRFFGKLFKERLVEKTYIAICQGKPQNNESEVSLSIADKKDKNKTSLSITKYKVFQTINNISNIIFLPKTGKTHQIRIVAKHLGCPIVGDTKYNIQNKFSFEKLKLNAHVVKFKYKDKDYSFVSNIPLHFKDFFRKNKLSNANFNNIL